MTQTPPPSCSRSRSCRRWPDCAGCGADAATAGRARRARKELRVRPTAPPAAERGGQTAGGPAKALDASTNDLVSRGVDGRERLRTFAGWTHGGFRARVDRAKCWAAHVVV